MLVLAAALLLRRLIAVWLLYRLYRGRATVAETAFLSWFAPVGVSALFYAMIAERRMGNDDIFPYVKLTIALSLVIHGLTSTPFGRWLRRHERR